MNAKHRRTLETLFAKQPPRTLPFRDIAALLKAVGCTVKEGEGSRISFMLGAERWTTHKPHPGKEAPEYQAKRARDFLEKLKVTP